MKALIIQSIGIKAETFIRLVRFFARANLILASLAIMIFLIYLYFIGSAIYYASLVSTLNVESKNLVSEVGILENLYISKKNDIALIDGKTLGLVEIKDKIFIKKTVVGLANGIRRNQ